MNALVRGAEEYLLNSLWQAPLLFAAAWLMARGVRRLGPSAEHRVWVGALLAQCVLPACAAPGVFTWLRQLMTAKGTARGLITVTLGVATAHGTAAAPAFVRSGVLLCALISVVVCLRLVWQSIRLRHLAAAATPVTLHSPDAAFFRNSCVRLHVVRVELASADTVQTPLTFGLRRPMLLLPPGFADQVSTAQLRATLGHELAHVARHDAAKQMLYRMLVLPLAYHPAVWFALRNIAETRERVCDQAAAMQTGDARQYARSLLELASLLTAKRPAQSHAIGLFDANQLERRVLMLNRRNVSLGRPLRTALVAASVLLAGAVCTSAVALHVNVSAGALAGIAPGVKVASGIMAGQVLSKVAPRYPEEAKKAKIQGAVVLAGVIGKDGVVESLKVISGPAELQGSAIDAVRQWVYKPYLLNGQPTEVETTITVNYSLAE